MGFYLAENFSHLDTRIRDEILNLINDDFFSCVLISHLVFLFKLQDKLLQEKIWNYIKGKNIEYWFGFFLANNFINMKLKDLEPKIQEKICDLMEKSDSFKKGLDNGLAHYQAKQ